MDSSSPIQALGDRFRGDDVFLNTWRFAIVQSREQSDCESCAKFRFLDLSGSAGTLAAAIRSRRRFFALEAAVTLVATAPASSAAATVARCRRGTGIVDSIHGVLPVAHAAAKGMSIIHRALPKKSLVLDRQKILNKMIC